MSAAELESVKPLVDRWLRQRGTCMDGESYGAALELAREAFDDGRDAALIEAIGIMRRYTGGAPDIEALIFGAIECARSFGSASAPEAIPQGNSVLIDRLMQFKATRHGGSIWLGDGVHDAIRVDELIAALSASKPTAPQWTSTSEHLPAEPGWYLAMLAPDNDWGLMSGTPLQVEFDAYKSKPKAFTCFYEYRGDEDISPAVTHWMPMPDAPSVAQDEHKGFEARADVSNPDRAEIRDALRGEWRPQVPELSVELDEHGDTDMWRGEYNERSNIDRAIDAFHEVHPLAGNEPYDWPAHYIERARKALASAMKAASTSADVAQGAEAMDFEWPPLPALPNQSFYAFDRALFSEHQMQGYANAYGEAVRAALTAPPAQTALTERVLTYRHQPDNIGAWRLGEACRRAADLPAGDYIDRGLVLLKELQAKGYGVITLATDQQEGGEQR